ncbi:ATP-grasp domain-containing protein [Streptomyces sp. NPDC007369]|uniref:ATP-grasp domain-containing protein n=1 Tax=Streptomyces sp. NPDC007369 TaxID=3154589 RepID=UPI0033E11A96
MNHVLVFAKTPYGKTPYDQWLAGSGIAPVILTTTEFAPGYGHLPHVYAFDDYDTNQLVDKTALRLARDPGLRVRAVFARAEADVVRAAQLRQLLGLPGQHTASALAFRDKVVMKDHLAGGPVEVPVYRLLDSAYAAVEFTAEHGYPVVIKPVSESGSLGAAVIRDEAELDAYLARPWRGAAQIETFVEGQMYHVDGLVAGGEVVFVHPFQYVNDCLSFRSNDWVGCLPLSPQDPRYDRLVKAAEAVLAELPTPERTAFHAELWLTPDDRVVFCEIASRTGGGMISAMVRHAFGIDLDKEWLYAECGLPSTLGTPDYRPTGCLNIPPAPGVLEHLPAAGADGAPDCLREISYTGAPGQTFHGGVKSGLYLAGYVVDGETEEAVAANMDTVAAWYSAHVRWRTASPEGSTP